MPSSVTLPSSSEWSLKRYVALRPVAVINYAVGKQGEFGPVTSADRQFLHLLGVDDLADLGVCPVQTFERSGHFQGSRRGAKFQRYVQRANFGILQGDLIHSDLTKTILHNRHLVGSDRQRVEFVNTRPAHDRLTSQSAS